MYQNYGVSSRTMNRYTIYCVKTMHMYLNPSVMRYQCMGISYLYRPDQCNRRGTDRRVVIRAHDLYRTRDWEIPDSNFVCPPPPWYKSCYPSPATDKHNYQGRVYQKAWQGRQRPPLPRQLNDRSRVPILGYRARQTVLYATCNKINYIVHTLPCYLKCCLYMTTIGNDQELNLGVVQNLLFR